MQTFRLIRAFRDFEIGDVFSRDEDESWYDGDSEDISSQIMETLLDVGGYLEDTTPVEVVWTPVLHSQVFVVTGAGEVKSKEFTDSDWFRLQKNFMGYFATRREAEDRIEYIRNLISDDLI